MIVSGYLALGLAYARATPAWQAPDEPAHYNYVAYVAERGQLPVLEPGDYPAGKIPIGPRARPADISEFRYESHQPPLFYALAALAFLVDRSAFALRTLSVLFGAGLLVATFLCARTSLPRRPWLWLAVPAFVAFIPMHLFVAGSVENDSLSELVLSTLLLGVLSAWPAAVLGLLLGLAVLTKVTIYVPALLLVAAAVRRRAGAAAQALAAAMVVSGWWIVRNALTYGWADPLAQRRQAEVAGSQVQSSGFGLPELWRFAATSFRSFWGQFGWMSIPLTEREYRALIVLTALACAGWFVVAIRRQPLPSGWPFLALAWVGVVAGDLAYNLKFVQPQGRYLFPALVPIAIFYVAGFAALFPRRAQPAALGALSMALLAFSAYALQRDLVPGFR